MKLLLLFFICFNAFAFDYGETFSKFKAAFAKIIKLENLEVKNNKLILPNIPTVIKDPKDTKIYRKKGKIFTQGNSFDKLSAEKKELYRLSFLKELYQVLLGRSITDLEMTQGLNILGQGGSREGIYRSIIMGREYRGLEEKPQVASKEMIDFFVFYTKKYLGLKYNRKQIAVMNPWSLKRILVEKTLEIIDAFPGDGNDLYVWYAILSKELAVNKRISWKNKTRAKESEKFHHRWAMSVPLQHIKSETIIKLFVTLST